MLHHRLLEGFLLRLARSRDADAFALRGGMLVRSWVPERRAGDADLVCRLDRRTMRAYLRGVLATDAGDGVSFDADRFRIDADPAGLTLFACGDVDGAAAEMHVDVAFGLDVWPHAQRVDMPFARGTARLFACRPEMLIGTKLRVLAELGARSWRPKDLADVQLLLRRFPRSATLDESIERSRASRQILAAPWWREPHAHARWQRGDLDAVLVEVRERLAA